MVPPTLAAFVQKFVCGVLKTISKSSTVTHVPKLPSELLPELEREGNEFKISRGSTLYGKDVPDE